MKSLISIFSYCLFSCFFIIEIAAQDRSCNDPKAKNTGSKAPCKYPNARKIFKKTTKLTDTLFENSGLLYDAGYIWTHNDGGGEAALYKINAKTGEIIQKINIKDAVNKDWEDLAQDESFIYIGDFGNNNGVRKDLRIYKVKKEDIGTNTKDVSAQVINFSYPEQTTFTRNDQHNFDCEGFVACQGELHLFTKNRGDAQTQHYSIPVTPGDYKAKLQGTFNTKGMVTAADLSTDGTLVLIGYTPRKLFMWICKDYNNTDFFSGNNRKVRMGRFLFRGQIEGVCFSESQKGYISAEGFKIFKPHLRQFSLEKW